jgi:hypothetical protein
MALSDIPQRQADYRLEQFEDELILFHPNQAKILYCNPTASLIWRLCDGRRTTAEIISLLRAAFPEAAATLTTEVQSTLAQFQQHGAIVCTQFDPAARRRTSN